MSVIPALRRLRQENLEFKANLSYIEDGRKEGREGPKNQDKRELCVLG
jgi:hypothetical protein